MSIFSQYQQEYYKKFPKKSPEEYQAKLKKFNEEKAKLEEKSKAEEKSKVEEKPKVEEKAKVEEKSKVETIEQESSKEPIKQEPIVEEKEEKPKKVDEKMLNISSYNGGVTEKYVWSQSVTDVTVQITVPKGTKSKNVFNFLKFLVIKPKTKLFVDFQPQHLKVMLKSSNTVILDGDLYDKIKVEDSIWSIEDGERVILTLEKAGENIWKTVIKGDQEIDATKVDNSKKLEEFDYETQVIHNFLKFLLISYLIFMVCCFF